MIKRRLFLTILYAIITLCSAHSQTVKRLTLDDVISIAQEQSLSSMIYRNSFLSNYWGFRAFQAEYRPSLNLSMGVGNFSRSLIQLQNSETGVISYRDNYNLQNHAQLSIQQKLISTGGTLALNTSLSRLDQYSPYRDITYYSQPLTLTYLQPLWTYNSFKWDKELEPRKYERAKIQYLENMEAITVNAVTYFFNYIIAQSNLNIAIQNYNNTKAMYGIAEERSKIGVTLANDLMQLELRMLNDSISINVAELSLRTQRIRLRSFLGYNDNIDFDLVLDSNLPSLYMDFPQVFEHALKNSSFSIDQLISGLEAENAIARARANRGISVSLSAKFGLSQSASEFNNAYRNLMDQEVVGLTLSVPIMDWGMGRGRVKVAEAQAEAVRYQIEQDLIDYEENVYVQVMQFNNQRQQCFIAERADIIAGERYKIMLENFANGSVSVTDLNTAQTEKDEANQAYINQLKNYWAYYYNIRKMSLYDYFTETDISAQFDKLVK